MRRRCFLAGLAACVAAQAMDCAVGQEPVQAAVEISESEAGPEIPQDFLGLSYETAQMANPDFFSASNVELVRLFRELTTKGVLRLGGGSSEFTTFDPHGSPSRPPFEAFGPDTSKTVKHGTVNTSPVLRNLRAFLDATGWKLIWGLNLGQGTVENAAEEAAAVVEVMGPRLVALQIGNEPDSFRNRYRPASYGPEDFMQEWNRFHEAIQARVPEAKFAGPDISNKVPYFTAFAAEAPRHKDVILLTAHAYAMGPAGSPEATIDNLLGGNPRLQTQPEGKLGIILQSAREAGLPYRMSEGNSCWDGGKEGVSDTLASALWCVDYMMHLAQRGVAGVNLHGGGNGFYTPIAGAPSTGFVKRPEYFGMQFVSELTGARFLRTTLAGAPSWVSAYALERSGQPLLVVVNKSGQPVVLAAGSQAEKAATLLSGPSLGSKGPITLRQVTVSSSSKLRIPGHSAVLYRMEGG